jgi:hypothetical protein
VQDIDIIQDQRVFDSFAEALIINAGFLVIGIGPRIDHVLLSSLADVFDFVLGGGGQMARNSLELGHHRGALIEQLLHFFDGDVFGLGTALG